ncbi:DUF1254 domain-containing protein [Carboxylicivirga sp. M1479]|uniref:DUF1254 domain-containing protein n=1 Tax=Carboxylicivirga sp. M1479 TaxID=2594476 RepID=UPI00163D5732|nr:DUF1254 domain-containing protein [Carboxylicivirga sp. M1479]
MKQFIALTGIVALLTTACNYIATEKEPRNTLYDQVALQDDPVISVAPNADIAAQGYYLDAKAMGTMAYQWGYAMVRMEQAMRDYIDVPNPKPATSYRAPLNEIGWAKRLPTAMDEDMPTANNDTYYMSAVVNLTEPYILQTPDTDGRYYVVNVFDMYHTLSEYIGKRNTGTQAQTIALVPPAWNGKLPSGIDKVVNVRTPKAWLWGRIHVLEGEDVSKVHALQDQFKLKAISEYMGQANMEKNTTLPQMPKYPVSDTLRFYRYLAFAMNQNPILAEDRALVGQLERIGIKNGKFDEASLNPSQLKGLKEAALEAPLTILSSMYSSSTIINGWNVATKLDDYGFDYGFRSLIAGPYLGGQGEKEAMYPIRYTDSDGEATSGKHSYTIRFEEEPPVNAFWSLTLYKADTKLFCDNELNRYKLSSESSGLKKNADGSFEILIQNEKPENTDNWLPAPEGGFYLILRMYEPHQDVIDLKYELPQMERIR